MEVYDKDNSTILFGEITSSTASRSFSVIVTTSQNWLPYEILFDVFKKSSRERTPDCADLYATNYGFTNQTKTRVTEKLFACLLFVTNAHQIALSTFRLLALKRNFYASEQLSIFKVYNVPFGDLVAGEILRKPKKNPGILKLDFHFWTTVLEYLFVGFAIKYSINKVLKSTQAGDILFSFPETAYKHELFRRLLIKNKIFNELVYNRYTSKLTVMVHKDNTSGKELEYAPTGIPSNKKAKAAAAKALNQRFSEGKQLWTNHSNDVNSRKQTSLPCSFDISKRTVIIFLQAVSDDQYRCGLDCFTSLDDFHRFSINSALSYGLNTVVKAHPGIKNPNNPDKSKIDADYLTTLFYDFGLSYDKTEKEESLCQSDVYPTLFSANSGVPIHRIAETITSFLVLTHHGNVVFESLHLGLPTLKYKLCKNRAYDYCHSWSNKNEYLDLIKWFSIYGVLPTKRFADSYLKVASILQNREKVPLYNAICFELAQKYSRGIKFPPSNSVELWSNVNILQVLYNGNIKFRKELQLALEFQILYK